MSIPILSIDDFVKIDKSVISSFKCFDSKKGNYIYLRALFWPDHKSWIAQPNWQTSFESKLPSSSFCIVKWELSLNFFQKLPPKRMVHLCLQSETLPQKKHFWIFCCISHWWRPDDNLSDRRRIWKQVGTDAQNLLSERHADDINTTGIYRFRRVLRKVCPTTHAHRHTHCSNLGMNAQKFTTTAFATKSITYRAYMYSIRLLCNCINTFPLCLMTTTSHHWMKNHGRTKLIISTNVVVVVAFLWPWNYRQ